MYSELILGEKQPQPKRWDLTTPTQAMRWAIEAAFRGAGRVSPNPMVGCVILDAQNRFLASGFHARLGEAHAEVSALEGLSESELKGAKVFVTLEPCAHEGRTPSCAKKLASLPISEVIFGLVDPNPLVSGEGANILKNSGKKVCSFVPQPGQDFYFAADKTWTESRINEWLTRLEETAEHFLWNQRFKKTFVSLKVATSLDGFMSLKNGESQWITGPEARLRGHYLRAFHEAILVGAQTARLDDPSLNVRHKEFPQHQNKVIVLDAKGELLQEAASMNLAKAHPPENLFFAIDERIKHEKNPIGAQVLKVGLGSDGFIDLKILMSQLWHNKIHSVLIEGGSKVFSSVFRDELWNRLYVFQGPILIGAENGRSWTSRLSTGQINQALRLNNSRQARIGSDFLLTGTKI